MARFTDENLVEIPLPRTLLVFCCSFQDDGKQNDYKSEICNSLEEEKCHNISVSTSINDRTSLFAFTCNVHLCTFNKSTKTRLLLGIRFLLVSNLGEFLGKFEDNPKTAE